MRSIFFALTFTACGGVMIEPGHRGLLFDQQAGLHHEVLVPGYHAVGASERIDDFDVAYAPKSASLHALASEGLPVDVEVSVTYRPIIAELYQLDSELGPSYAELITPELRVAVLRCIARHSFMDLTKLGTTLSDETEADLRQHMAGKHVEIAAVSYTSIVLPKEIVDALARRQARDL